MTIRSCLLFLLLFTCATTGVAQEPSIDAAAAAAPCPQHPPMKRGDWLVEPKAPTEYPGLHECTTTMTLDQRHPWFGEPYWQIKFSNPTAAPTSAAAPGVDSLRFTFVDRDPSRCKNDAAGSAPKCDFGADFFGAAIKTIRGCASYYAAAGTVDGVPTMATLVVYESTPQREFRLTLVKLRDVAHATPDITLLQGGVIHGHEN